LEQSIVICSVCLWYLICRVENTRIWCPPHALGCVSTAQEQMPAPARQQRLISSVWPGTQPAEEEMLTPPTSFVPPRRRRPPPVHELL